MAGPEEDFLSRWSWRKREARSGAPVEALPPPAPQAPLAVATPGVEPRAAPPPDELPAVEALTPESDFAPFMDSKVDPDVRRQALQKLFADPHFNVMDGLDVYIDDYSLPDPMPPEWLGQLAQMAGLGDVPGRQKAEREARKHAERQAREQAGGLADDAGSAPTSPGSALPDVPGAEGAADAAVADAGAVGTADWGDADERGLTLDGDERRDAAIPAPKVGD